MKIGVLIPVYNAAETIAATLDSVLAQTVLPYEICLVDDGSTDNSDSIIRQYAHGDNSILWKIISQENAGLGAARNAGMQVMTADYIAFLDADDVWISHKVEHIANAIKSHPKSDLFYHPIWEWTPETGSLRKRRDVEITQVEDIWLYNPITPSACVIRKDAMDWSFDTTPSIHGVEDALMWTKAYHENLVFTRLPYVDTRYRIGYGMTKNEDEHDQHIVNAIQIATENGWITHLDSTSFVAQRQYHRARNAHKSGEFKKAIECYKKAPRNYKTGMLALFARLHIKM